MVNAIINGKAVCVKEGTTILEASKELGIYIPTLCYLKNVSDIGACRVCVVEVKGTNRLVSSCNTELTEGMEVVTESPRILEARKNNVQLILSQHRTNCPACVRSGSCALQKIANDLNLVENEFEDEPKKEAWENDFPLIRDASKCIGCLRCVQFCDKVQSLGVWDLVNVGSRASVRVSEGRNIKAADCALCGQCITHCPVGALRERDDTDRLVGVKGALRDESKVTVVQVAPAVRAAWGEAFGLAPEVATEKRLAAVLRRIGFTYVFDTNFTADLTIMEEGTEFLGRLAEKEKYAWPMFTSCCPGWVRFLKSQYPDMVPQLSTAKSPQQMFGAVAKTYFAGKIGKTADEIVSVSVMPCVAKKAECDYEPMKDSGAKDVDFVLTTRELCRLTKALHIDVASLPEEDFDSPLGSGTGAAVIFGATGGVMEAALRTCCAVVCGKNPDADAFSAVRGNNGGWREADFDLNGTIVHTAIASGLGNTRKLIEAIRAGKVSYDFVEIMACPGGCVGGGGQPISEGIEMADERGQVLYNYDKSNPIRFSHENPDVQTLYAEYFGKPCSEKSHHLLHTEHDAWEMPLAVAHKDDFQ